MRYKITHESVYTFSKAVFLEPHYLKFRPQVLPFQQLADFQLDISPQPDGLSQQKDTHNNLVDYCWFSGQHDRLQIRAAAVVEMKEYNPFNYILYPPACIRLPFSYSQVPQTALAPYLSTVELSPDLLALGQEILQETAYSTSDFLMQLTQRIHADFTAIYRATGEPYAPDITFRLKEGSCRDLVWMMIHLLRSMGIAARFVSGYNYLKVAEPTFELHAWVEVFLPGAGWIGFDPTHGIATSDAHIVLAVGSHFAATMPVQGNVRGSAASELTTDLVIEEEG